ncbi:hypothetical protein SAMN04488691_11042 [Haloferax larsenii]|uniref:Uncharacterized protein n=1 Tax=Haloferax larsenii TaxID=302484 RepID=A0A1H7TTF5_HALLR|nr:hypothetical protein SAMN04488691_11042 [Haloferax larsenii]
MLTRTVAARISGTRTRLGHAVLNSNAVLVHVRIGIALVANTDIAIKEFERERLVLRSLENTRRWIELW